MTMSGLKKVIRDKPRGIILGKLNRIENSLPVDTLCLHIMINYSKKKQVWRSKDKDVSMDQKTDRHSDKNQPIQTLNKTRICPKYTDAPSALSFSMFSGQWKWGKISNMALN